MEYVSTSLHIPGRIVNGSFSLYYGDLSLDIALYFLLWIFPLVVGYSASTDDEIYVLNVG